MSKIENIKLNWKSIKSAFIIKKIFSFFKTKQKLNIIIYNKQLQEAIGIDIENIKNKWKI